MTSTHCVAQVLERMKSVRHHRRMSILRRCIVPVFSQGIQPDISTGLLEQGRAEVTNGPVAHGRWKPMTFTVFPCFFSLLPQYTLVVVCWNSSDPVLCLHATSIQHERTGSTHWCRTVPLSHRVRCSTGLLSGFNMLCCPCNMHLNSCAVRHSTGSAGTLLTLSSAFMPRPSNSSALVPRIGVALSHSATV